MRLDKFKIGSAKDSPAHSYKNLKDISIDFDEKHWVTVVIGWNGTGKSNVLEALSIIFRELISPAKPNKPQIPFAFELSYEIGKGEKARKVFLENDPDRKSEPLKVRVSYSKEWVQGDPVKSATFDLFSEHKDVEVRLSAFLKDPDNLPRFVFSYYSGESDRLQNVYTPYLTKYDKKLRAGEDPGLKRLFFALPEHSQFVLLAFLIGQSDVVSKFLEKQLSLEPESGLDSVLFVLRQPPWTSKEGDERFWNAKGVVQGFLNRLMDIAICPVNIKRTEVVSQWGNRKALEFKYLLVKDLDALKRLVGEQEPAEFFRDLESTHVSQLIEDVRINVRVKKNKTPVTFSELSEGERQLLTVLGLMRFTAGEESLFLLDEPDTHLNPRWSVDYLNYIQKFIASTDDEQEDTSHIVLTTHNPMAIAELEREQVQILSVDDSEKHRRVVANMPDESPKGMGYASIVTSDMFGIASTLDQDTQDLLEEQRELGSKDKLSLDDAERLTKINKDLDRLGFRFFHPDDEYSRYLRLRSNALQQRFEDQKRTDVAEGVSRLSREEREEIANDVIADLLAQGGEDNE
ncbi:DNA replication and repair protein RecF [Pseudovibrio sp. W64]|uniref:AAA family ATPase n=1 Tax=Pseudovibrio sp. W64 TaxID=1735583 RepID=UPI0007AE5361|nr:AAA family ATPase [Pseudovibrio sp. W64]KZK79374.1 DNA replication and repair protein RecF [Pseudovibrio sp. W64]